MSSSVSALVLSPLAIISIASLCFMGGFIISAMFTVGKIDHLETSKRLLTKQVRDLKREIFERDQKQMLERMREND